LTEQAILLQLLLQLFDSSMDIAIDNPDLFFSNFVQRRN